ncbi:glycosidase [Gracilibacillus halotolerans]|uniref:Glycosidase n=1 Tax=Gracilibacillus halotolerans TaxID=74386 RepID=A0A841RP69_9BACI|nr:glycoside hydrolase family 13 protein [Gracilibacillus halotolerans]MBB6512734.1 glycosidase [Gracilibacillus halotolerans]
MFIEAIYHRAIQPYLYAKDKDTVHILLETKAGDVDKVELLYGDPYDFKDDQWQFKKLQMKLTGSTARKDYWGITIKPEFRRLRYGFRCSNQQTSVVVTEKGFYENIPREIGQFFCFPYVHEADVFQPPAWVKDTIWYQVFPERFANGDSSLNPDGTLEWGSGEPTPTSFYGGDFQGVIDHLDYLQELGVNGIYFTPIFKAHSNHKYDTIDYFEIDPQFGDKETFRRLVKECHLRGMKVMLDAVFNHSGFYFPPFQDVLKNQQESKYVNWFYPWDFPIQTEPMPNYDTFAFVSTMPKLNTSDPEVRNYLLKVATYWIEEFDIDGWRLDVANEIDHSFWRDFRQVVKKVKPEAYILGEVWHDSLKWLQGDQFDAVMNYPFTDAVIEFFAKDTIDCAMFKDRVTEVQHSYPSNVNEVSFNLLGSHDTARILTLANGNIAKVKLMLLFQLSYTGSPCIYYGDEVGMTGGEDPGCRECMEWDPSQQNRELLSFVKQLIHLRKNIATFGNDATFRFEQADNNVVIYSKKAKDTKLVFALNNNEFAETVNTDILCGKEVVDVFTGEKIRFDGQAEIVLAPYGFICVQF